MRKKRKNTNKDILIDLTSLLDVIFIVLLVVVCGQGSLSEGLLEKQKEAENAKQQAETVYELYSDQLEMADSLNQYVWAVSVIVPYDENEITKRQIMVLKEGKEIECIDLIGNDVRDARETFKECLAQFIQVQEEKPVILSLNENDDNILYRDEVMVHEVFMELSAEFSNVYIKGNISEDDK